MENNQLSKKEEYDLRKAEKEQMAVSTKRRSGMGKRLSLWFIAFLAVGASIFGLMSLSGGGAPPAAGTASLLDTLSDRDAVKGSLSAQVTLIEYSDFQCPACAAYHPIVKKLVADYGDKIAFGYRHFPLLQHQHAKLAAYAAEAAGRQGKFWEMHDKIFEGQKSWSIAWNAKKIFIEYASSLGLDMDKFKKDLDDPEIKAKVEADYKSGVAAGVNGTPSFFLEGKKIANPQGEEEFRRIIDAALASDQ